MSKFKPNYRMPDVMTPENTTREVIEQMQGHVDSYLSLSRHRHNCLELCRRLEDAEAQLKAALDDSKLIRGILYDMDDRINKALEKQDG